MAAPASAPARRVRGVGRSTAVRVATALVPVAAPPAGRAGRATPDRAYGGPRWPQPTRWSWRSPGSRSRSPARARCSSPSGARPSSTSSSYYLSVGEPLMAAMGGRPVLLQRFPNGAGGHVVLPEADPRQRARLAADHDRQHPERHHVPRPRRRRPRPCGVGGQPRLPRLPCLALPRPDPGTRTSCASISIRSPASRSSTSARRPPRVRALLGEPGIVGHPKTTGNRGLHVYVRLAPRWDSIQVRAAAVAVARELERRRPELITAAWWKEERGTRVFVDFNQNAPHKTVFGAWSVRAGRAGRCRRRSPGTSSRRSIPTS